MGKRKQGMTASKNNEESIAPEALALLERLKSVQLATVNESNAPAISYTPFVMQEQKVYIFISALAAHTQHLKQQPHVSLLFIEDEQDCKNIFARKRLSLDCEALLIDRSKKNWTKLLDQFTAEHGNTVALLRTLPDFSLFELSPKRGSFIKGFGQAYRFQRLEVQHARLDRAK